VRARPATNADRSARQWKRPITLAAAVGIPFFFAAKLGLGLPAPGGFVAVFWPAMGFGCGLLIGLGPNARWPALFGITVANFLANFSSGDPPQIAAATNQSNAPLALDRKADISGSGTKRLGAHRRTIVA
jgi:hypothetical protein